ncbi:MAG: fimbrillin family protein [Rikenellaceae bacterium]|nr:fimbrillin family protein [Rikenellaceae bacterium]
MQKLLLGLRAAAALAGCSKNEEGAGDPDAKSPIVFGSGIEVKAIKTGTQFADNDEIGIYAYKGSVPASAYDGAFLRNAGFVFTSNAFGIGTDDPNADNAYWDRGQTHNFYAYYPVATTVASATGYQLTEATASAAPAVTVKAKAGTGIEEDLLWARLEGQSYVAVTASGKPGLDFTHKLSRISFLVKLEAGAPACSLSNVTLSLDKDQATLNLVSGVQAAGGAAVTLSKDVATATAVTEAGITADDFSPIVPTGASVTDLKLTINGEVITADVSSLGMSLAEGMITTITVTVKKSGTVFTSKIGEWTNGGTNGSTEI